MADSVLSAPQPFDDDSPYLVDSRMEILGILRAIAQKKALITAHFPRSTDFILTSILDISEDGEEVFLDYGANEELNHKALASGGVVCTTNQDRVKVQFATGGLEQVWYGGGPAFRIDLPAKLLRMQRREYYRITIPVTQPLKCIIPSPLGPDRTLAPRGAGAAEIIVLDISLGGIAVIDHHYLVHLDPGVVLPNCRIELPEVGEITVIIEVCNTFEMTLKNGLSCKRSGCRFLDIQNPARTLVQRYILKLERERNAKLTGLA